MIEDEALDIQEAPQALQDVSGAQPPDEGHARLRREEEDLLELEEEEREQGYSLRDESVAERAYLRRREEEAEEAKDARLKAIEEEKLARTKAGLQAGTRTLHEAFESLQEPGAKTPLPLLVSAHANHDSHIREEALKHQLEKPAKIRSSLASNEIPSTDPGSDVILHLSSTSYAKAADTLCSVLDKQLSLLSDWSGRGSHVDYTYNEAVPLVRGRWLGRGINGDVYETSCKGVAVAWKTIYCRHGISHEERKEIELLKKLRHEHIVRLVGTYSHAQFLGLLLWPVATCDLATVLEDLEALYHPESLMASTKRNKPLLLGWRHLASTI
ncbi:hypothetical protein W97_03950 [Coniosporium apollinis CBS 100218]|uniref:Protein kinase domain-containing protein n=1 Tax=Coniosporium apollinis (strain CBS 100218) TaxID=1168221 RepID=R7YS13_CONA1|nr:uncharacterized protein W97_03950 [Coniosporium apollinis CBS 100218]EON64717.1 hypothetical protein W97_03950 [Coniosporium apollinis CBS 100218]